MNKPFDDKRRIDFRKILLDLSKSQTFLKDSKERSDFYLRLEALYYINNEDSYRHYYSDIFRTLVEIQKFYSTENGNIDTLGQNIAVLCQNYKAVNKKDGITIDISPSLQKLYDHVSLDIARIQYSDSGDDKLSNVY